MRIIIIFNNIIYMITVNITNICITIITIAVII